MYLILDYRPDFNDVLGGMENSVLGGVVTDPNNVLGGGGGVGE